jgi:hypothetical protein
MSLKVKRMRTTFDPVSRNLAALQQSSLLLLAASQMIHRQHYKPHVLDSVQFRIEKLYYDALRTALGLRDIKADQIDWAQTQSNLALAQRRLGDVTDDLPTLNTARQGYGACEALDYQTDAPFGWAVLQWNIADLALARYRLDPDPALLSEAKIHVTAARAFFVDGSDYPTERCDDLLAKIKTAEAARP